MRDYGTGAARLQAREFAWSGLSDRGILDIRIRNLGLTLRDTWLEDMVARLHQELADRGLRFRPHCWLSTEWFSPDGIPGIAIPFYLAHPRLMGLERKHMLDVEGGTVEACMRLLRHEAGHAIDSAFRLRRRREWRDVFGPSSRKYPTRYRPRPGSRKYVLHLDWWYAQSHPTEDFAETFAVWLKPGSRWRRDYWGWEAMHKLEYVDRLMQELAGETPTVQSRTYVEPVREIDMTVGEYLHAKRAKYIASEAEFFDRDLERLFPTQQGRKGMSATTLLRRIRPTLRGRIARRTGSHPYTVDLALKEMIQRSEALGLRTDTDTIEFDALARLTIHVVRHVQRGGYDIPV